MAQRIYFTYGLFRGDEQVALFTYGPRDPDEARYEVVGVRFEQPKGALQCKMVVTLSRVTASGGVITEHREEFLERPDPSLTFDPLVRASKVMGNAAPPPAAAAVATSAPAPQAEEPRRATSRKRAAPEYCRIISTSPNKKARLEGVRVIPKEALLQPPTSSASTLTSDSDGPEPTEGTTTESAVEALAMDAAAQTLSELEKC